MRRIIILVVAFAVPWLIAATPLAWWQYSAYQGQWARANDPRLLATRTAIAEMDAARTLDPALSIWDVVAAISVDIANVRSGPSIDASVIAQVKYGTQLPVLGQEKDWYKIQLPDGREGYVAGGWVVGVEGAIPTLKPLPSPEAEYPYRGSKYPDFQPTPFGGPQFEHPFYRIPTPYGIDPGVQPQGPSEWHGDDGILGWRGPQEEWVVGAGR